MKTKGLNIVDDICVARLDKLRAGPVDHPTSTQWIKILRASLRMTQEELAEHARMPQSHIAAIESGKVDPQLGTLKRIYEALSCELVVQPRPRKPIKKLLRSRARAVALDRLNRATGTMALEGQAPEEDVFRRLLEKKTDEILADPSEHLRVNSSD